MELTIEQIEELRKQYRVELNSDEFKQALEDVRKMIFYNKHPVVESEIPTMVFVGGQQGSGKNQLMLLDGRDSDNVVRLILDECTPFHPGKDEILELYPDLYAYFTYEFGLAIRNALYDEATEGRYNVRTEGTLKDTNDTVALINKLRRQRYRVETEVMATGIIESAISIFERYEKEIEEQNIEEKENEIRNKKRKEKVPRLVEWKYTYDNIPETIKEIESFNLADSIKIFTRGVNENNPNLVYATNADRSDYETAYDCITTIRELDNIRAKRTFIKRFKFLERKMINRHATNRELIQLRSLSKGLKERHQIDVYDGREI